MESQGTKTVRMPFQKLCDLFMNVLERVLTARALAEAPCENLSPSQWQGLLFVVRNEPCSIRQLAEGLNVSHPAAVKLAERLARKGLVERRESEADRRVVELRLSPRGQQCVNTVRDRWGRDLERIMARLEHEDAERLRRGLQAFLEAALKDEETAEAVCLHCGQEHVGECLVAQAQTQAKQGNAFNKLKKQGD